MLNFALASWLTEAQIKAYYQALGKSLAIFWTGAEMKSEKKTWLARGHVFTV